MKRFFLINFRLPILLVVLLLLSGCSITRKTSVVILPDVPEPIIANEDLPYLEPLSEDNQPNSFTLSNGYEPDVLAAHASHYAFGIDGQHRYEFMVYEINDSDPAINGVHLAIRTQVGSSGRDKSVPAEMHFFDPNLDIYKLKSVKAVGDTLKLQVEEEYYLDVEGEGLTLKREENYEFKYDVANDFLYIVK